MTTKVYYHDPCDDGFGAAFAAWKALGKEDVQYIPYQHGSKINLAQCDEDDTIYFLDMCPDTKVLAALIINAAKVVVIDHHLSAEGKVPEILAMGVEMVYDQEYSGCMLAQGYFHKGEGVPKLFPYLGRS